MSSSEVRLPWSTSSQRWGHPWHSMCSYLGSFPASLAHAFIAMLSDEGDVVLDPFCGRGTTLLESRLLGRVCLASDLNPIAVALARAKNADVDLETVYERIEALEKRFNLDLYIPEAQVQPEDIALIYHPHALAQLCYLRRKLLRSEAPVDEFLVGLTLGIMHGSERQDGSSTYASISMPNTFSMSPNYVRRFVQSKRLSRVDRNVFGILREKAKRTWSEGGSFATSGVVARADAKSLAAAPEFSDFEGAVDLVLTSPPYLNVVNYALQNWIRMWFLNEDVKDADEVLDDDLTLGEWAGFAMGVVHEIKKMMREGGVAVLVVGDVVRSANSVVSPARELIRRVHHEGTFSYVGCLSDHLHTAEKTTRIWKETKGKATSVDRIVILSDSPPRFRDIDLEGRFSSDRTLFDASRKNVFLDPYVLADEAASFAGL